MKGIFQHLKTCNHSALALSKKEKMKKVRFTRVIFTLLVPTAYSQVTKFQFRPDYPTVDRIARQYEKEKGPGFALAILEGDKVTYSTSKGQANLSSGKKLRSIRLLTWPRSQRRSPPPGYSNFAKTKSSP